MNKEVIYIDVDDDITSIISKVKSIEAKIIAIVPPKRIGILQSAVNLRILQKVARDPPQGHKFSRKHGNNNRENGASSAVYGNGKPQDTCKDKEDSKRGRHEGKSRESET